MQCPVHPVRRSMQVWRFSLSLTYSKKVIIHPYLPLSVSVSLRQSGALLRETTWEKKAEQGVYYHFCISTDLHVFFLVCVCVRVCVSVRLSSSPDFVPQSFKIAVIKPSLRESQP